MVCEGGALPCLLQCPGNGGSSEEQALLGSRSCCIQTGSASRVQQQRLLRLRLFFCLLSPGSPCQLHRHTCGNICLPTEPLPFRGLPTPDPCLRTTPPRTTINPCLNFALQRGPPQFLCVLTGHSSSVQGPSTKRCQQSATYAFLPSGPLLKTQSELI